MPGGVPGIRGGIREEVSTRGLNRLQNEAESLPFDELMERKSSPLDAATETASSENDQKLREAANQMEGLFIGLLMKQVRKTVRLSDPFRGGWAGKVFRERLDSKYAEAIASSSKFGLAEAVYQRLSSGRQDS